MSKLPRIIPALGLSLMMACATMPKSTEERQALRGDADSALATMTARDADLAPFLEQSAGYAVFPEVGKGGALIGGAYGRGILYEQGQPMGFVELNQGSIGAVLGGQTFSEIVVFQTPQALAQVKDGDFNNGGEASAVVLKAGAAASTSFSRGVAVFVTPVGGLMADLSVSGQTLNYRPMPSRVAQAGPED